MPSEIFYENWEQRPRTIGLNVKAHFCYGRFCQAEARSFFAGITNIVCALA
jgi:hypothetical protein